MERILYDDISKLKEKVLNNIDNYYLALITTCNCKMVCDKNQKQYRIFEEIKYSNTEIELVNKKSINHYEGELNLHNDIGDNWYCNEIDLYKLNEDFKNNLELYINGETDSILYSEEYGDVLNTLELEKSFFNAKEEFERQAKEKTRKVFGREEYI